MQQAGLLPLLQDSMVKWKIWFSVAYTNGTEVVTAHWAKSKRLLILRGMAVLLH